MDPFTYQNIFDTKGIEYLIIIGFFLLLIPFWFILNKKVAVPVRNARPFGVLVPGILTLPRGLMLSKNHVWAHLLRNGLAEVGLDDLLIRITGNVNLNNLRKQGEPVTKGDLIAEIARNGKSLKIYSPISGEIMAVNQYVISNPWLLNDDPYGKGWIYKIKPTSWMAETSTFRVAGDASAWLKNELSRFRDFLMQVSSGYIQGTPALVLQDGGELKENLLSGLPVEVWNNFQEDFMSIGEKCSTGGICE